MTNPWRRFAQSLFACLLAASLAAAAEPPARGSITGRVLDDAGAPLAGLRVSAVGLQAGEDYAANTDASGAYRMEGVLPGLYLVTATLPGYVTGDRPSVAVAAGQSVAVDLTLKLLTIEELLNVQVKSASKLDERTREAPSVISVIPREQLQDYGWDSASDVLDHQPGFGPAQDYDRVTVASRGSFEGWNNNHLLHLVDGIPFNDDLYGTAYTWEISPLFLARTVEVLRGPGSALYGSNAVNGVVQVNTLSPADMDGKGEARVRLGEAGTQVYEAVGGFGAKNTVGAVAGYSSFQTDGNEYDSLDGSGRVGADGQLATFRTNDRRGGHYAWTKLEGGHALEGLQLQFHEQYWDLQTGHGWLWWIPDFRESMHETRRLVSLTYRPKSHIGQEYVVRWQHHAIDWNTRYYPDGAFDGFYPAGLWEYLDTSASDVFGRAQLTFTTRTHDTLLLGVEGDRFSYDGDVDHTSNVNLDDAADGFPPFPDNATTHLGPWLDYIAGHPILNLAAYGQYSLRGLYHARLNITLGGRFDHTGLDYENINAPGRPQGSRSFDRFSPRLALVYLPNYRLALKLLAGSAFRAPSPTELAGAHTFSLASNIQQLKPEQVKTGEIAVEWQASRFVSVRANGYLTKLQNEIAYSAANFNLSTNIYTLKTTGLEAEVLVSRGKLSGFLNYAYAHRLDEEIIDQTIATSPDQLTWVPAHQVNAGVSYSGGRLRGALSTHVQGSVSRRDSDVGVQTIPYNFVDLDMDQYRPQKLGSWATLDARLAWELPHDFELAAVGTNLFDTANRLVKVQPFPFDYRGVGRRLSVEARVRY